MEVLAGDLPAAQRVACAVAGKTGVDKAVLQLFIAPSGDAQARALHYERRAFGNILDKQTLIIEALRVPLWHFQAERLAQQRLPGTEGFAAARSTQGIWVVGLHLRQAGGIRMLILPGVGRFDQYRIARAMGAEVQRITAAGVVHIDMPAIHKQRPAFVGVAEGCVAAFFRQVIGLGFDDARTQPALALFMADHLA